MHYIELNLLTQHYNLNGKPLSSRTSASSANSPISQLHHTPLDTPTRRTFVYIEILPTEQSSSTCSTYDLDRSYGSSVPTDGIFSSNGVTDVFHPSSHPRPICTIDPTITFIS